MSFPSPAKASKIGLAVVDTQNGFYGNKYDTNIAKR
jgi:hypothetical protein